MPIFGFQLKSLPIETKNSLTAAANKTCLHILYRINGDESEQRVQTSFIVRRRQLHVLPAARIQASVH